MAVLFATATNPLNAQRTNDDRKTAFFSEHIEPVLKEHCFECHSAASKPVRGGLRLDYSDVLRAGGETGPIIEPGHPNKSLLIQALQHRDGLEMPPDKPLGAHIVKDFSTWIADGAVDSRGHAPEIADVRANVDHWGFQPIRNPSLPAVENDEHARNDIDRFILSRLESEGIEPSAEADRQDSSRIYKQGR